MNVTSAKIRINPILIWSAAIMLAAFSAPALGQNPKLDMRNLEPLAKKASEVVDVNLDGPLLKLASKFLAEDNDPEDRDALGIAENLKGIYVKNFEFDKAGEYSPADVESIRSQLQSPAWSRIVRARSRNEGETTEIYLMTAGDGGTVLGMAILNAEPKELTVVNIVGPVDMDKLSSLEGKMGIPRMGDKEKDSPRKATVHHEGTK
jgi:Domain of unknown function (DUF4252)